MWIWEEMFYPLPSACKPRFQLLGPNKILRLFIWGCVYLFGILSWTRRLPVQPGAQEEQPGCSGGQKTSPHLPRRLLSAGHTGQVAAVWKSRGAPIRMFRWMFRWMCSARAWAARCAKTCRNNSICVRSRLHSLRSSRPTRLWGVKKKKALLKSTWIGVPSSSTPADQCGGGGRVELNVVPLTEGGCTGESWGVFLEEGGGREGGGGCAKMLSSLWGRWKVSNGASRSRSFQISAYHRFYILKFLHNILHFILHEFCGVWK